MRSKVRQCQLMRQTTSIRICWQQGREEGGEDLEWAWLCEQCVAPEMRLAVAWAVSRGRRRGLGVGVVV